MMFPSEYRILDNTNLKLQLTGMLDMSVRGLMGLNYHLVPLYQYVDV